MKIAPRGGGANGAPGGAAGCGLRVVSMDGSTTDVPDSEKNHAFFGAAVEPVLGQAFPQARRAKRRQR